MGSRSSSRLWPALLVLIVALFSNIAFAANETIKHEAGRCAMRGSCGKLGFFGGELPCPDNGLAKEPGKDTRKKLVEICGDAWSEGPICCDDDQLQILDTNLQKANTFISACPACKVNFFNLFCTFTCSPDQSTFVNVTETDKTSAGKTVVTELDNIWSDEYASGFYESCKEVKFGGAGQKAMSFIGGGAKNYTEFLKFLGDKKPLFGSPFQINFPRPEGLEHGGIVAADPVVRACNDSNKDYRCSCVDCPDVCPELAEVTEQQHCYVGLLPCLSFASIITYAVFLILLSTAIVGHVAHRKYSRERDERLQLLQDTAPSDDEDEGDMVHNAGILDRPQRHYRLNQFFDRAFAKLGKVCARYPVLTIGGSVVAVAFLSLGWSSFGIEKDPVRLWVSPTSAAAQEKEFYDRTLGPFYRIEQVFLVNDTKGTEDRPVLSRNTLEWWFDVERQVQQISSLTSGTVLYDVCLNPAGTGCVVQSVSGYFGGDVDNIGTSDTWQQHIRDCAETPINCLPDFGQPLDSNLLLGGWQHTGDIVDSQAMITSWVVRNHVDEADNAEVMEWEEALKDFLQSVQQEAEDRGLKMSFSTEISLEQELNSSTNTDAKIVVISYIIMFIYASFALGSTSLSFGAIISNPTATFVKSKFSLGIMGIIIVLMSVSASVGLFSAMGIKSTLIIAEVIPFLVLAVGVDNIFLIVHEFDRVNAANSDASIETKMSRALGRMGPSILLSGLTETITFALGIVVGMPAVKNFAIYATGAVFINAVLQVTMFIAVLALNQRRVESNRIDCIPCIKARKPKQLPYHQVGSDGEGESTLQYLIRKHYAPALLDRRVKVAVIAVFLGIFAAGVALMPKIELGLDQRIALPTESYLVSYFDDLQNYFDVGPPVYFVTRNVNATTQDKQKALCGSFGTCEVYSLPTILAQEAKRPNVSYITGISTAWVDDFFHFLHPDLADCCKENGKTCFEDRDPPWNVTLFGMPIGAEFVHYLGKWLDTPTDETCALGGKATYSDAILIDNNHTSIEASAFRIPHTALRTQEDFIKAYASARRIADDFSTAQNVEVFPYSKFYIFFDQYATIVQLTGTLIGSALAMILVVASILLGSLATGAIVTVTVAMIITDILGTMALANVSLNAVSLVNLVICVGIGVEFCAHIARAFMFPSALVMEKAKNKFRGKDARVWTAMVNVGGSVFSGITITKLLGVSVLAFTRSKIFEIFYFRIWISLVAFAATHALIFLPVVLSLFGGEGYLDSGSEDMVDDDLAARRYRALVPEDEYDSDEY